MGFFLHHAVVVTSWKNDLIHRAQDEAIKTGNLVSDIVRSNNNGYLSFFVAPDGSKEGWPDSDKGDQARATFIEWLRRQRYEDGSSALEWSELVIGGDTDQSYVTRHSGEDSPAGER